MRAFSCFYFFSPTILTYLEFWSSRVHLLLRSFCVNLFLSYVVIAMDTLFFAFSPKSAQNNTQAGKLHISKLFPSLSVFKLIISETKCLVCRIFICRQLLNRPQQPLFNT